MSATRRPRSTRDRPAKPPLSEEVIIEVALEILRSDGLDAVTVRRVAAALDTGSASLYVYVGGRDELRQAMLDRVAALVTVKRPDPNRWRDQIHLLLTDLLAALDAHAGIAAVAVANPPAGPHSLRIIESLLALLRAGKIDDRAAAWACDALWMITTATAVEADVHRARGQDSDTADEMVAEISGTIAGLQPADYPNLTRLSMHMVSGDRRARFCFLIDLVVDGLIAGRSPAGSSDRA